MIADNTFIDTKSSSDKITHHGYHRIYPWFLNNFKDLEQVNMLEIGIEGYASINLWERYFSSVNIDGIDIDKKESNNPNVNLYQVDQSSERELRNFAFNKVNKYHFIIDDGSHVPEHQLLTLGCLWDTLIDGGVYIIEDIETSYWGRSKIYGYNFDANRVSFIEEIKNVISTVNKEFHKKNSPDKLYEDIEMVTFAYNCVILVKKNIKYEEFYNREYRFQGEINRMKFVNRLKRVLQKSLKRILF